MDRQIVYAGSIPLDTDLLLIQRHTMAAFAALTQAVLGTVALADGFPCSPASGDYTVSVGPGSFTAPLFTDGTPFGALDADSTLLMQTALHPDATTLQLTPPSDGTSALTWLVQVAVMAQDAGPVALPYWNAANPSVPYSGPGNSGLVQNTQRLLRAVISCKAGTVADPGSTGLFTVTARAGQPQIAASDIVPVPDAPTLRFALPAMPPGPTEMSTFGSNSSWQVPGGVRRVRVRVVGGGGGGGGGDTGYAGGGGGAGGYAEALLAVTPGTGYEIVVGAAGSGGDVGQTGGAGGVSGFGGLVTAGGGQGGASLNPDVHGGAPGEGLIGSLLQAGGYGGDGAVIANVPGGTGGASAFGGGGRGADPGGLPTYGRAAGSGGGGGYGVASPGGVGAGGLVIIEY